jgi:methyltransferase (TIGR00027 family)
MQPSTLRKTRSGAVFFLIAILLASTAHAVDPGKTSYTAEAVCAFRSIGALDPDPKTRNPDFMAQKFVNRAFKQGFPGLGLDYEDAKFAMDRMNSGVFYYVNARTLHMDAMLTQALKQGARQVVIMGAGFDSRAYRFHDDYPEVRFFEIDLPATSADKQRRVQTILGMAPKWVTYVPIDFNTQTLDEVLGKAGFANNQKTFFIWEGVTYYISPAGVDNTLRYIAERSAPGSRIVFDYMLEKVVKGIDYSPYGARRTVFHVAHRGEPYVFGIIPQQLETFINLRGLTLLSDLGPKDLTQRYLIRSDGTHSGKISEFLRIVHAQVPEPAEKQQLVRRAESAMQTNESAKANNGATHTVDVPDDVQTLLDGISRCIAEKDFDALSGHYSPNYRYRGVGRQQAVAFIERLYRSRPPLQHKIILTRFDRIGDKAQIDGFIQRKGFRIPLLSSEIIKEADGHWRMYGNHQ